MLLKTHLIICFLLITSFNLFSQNAKSKFDKSNAIEGDSIEYCATHKRMAEVLKDPKIAASYENSKLLLKSKPTSGTEKGTVYIIPVVFHVLHNYGPENISKEQILDALAILNRDYRLQNADTALIHPSFVGLPSDVEIEFQLATIAPNGNCFSGITRTASSWTNNGTPGETQLNIVKNGNDVYHGEWPADKYLNILIAENVGDVTGYSYFPGTGTTMHLNTIRIKHNFFGSIGTSSVNSSRVLTHEVGHWLGLFHVWGENNNPGASACNLLDDGIQDTPLCIGSTTCTVGANTCDDSDDPNNWSSWTFDVVDNYDNYMDYSYCSKMFTPDQVSKMRGTIISSISGRNNLITSTNHIATGINLPLSLCKADFKASKTVICTGEVINFNDLSYNTANGWTWTFTGGTPSSSTDQNPSISYSVPGTYTVTLQATDGTSSNTETKIAYIKVLPISTNIPFLETFENYTSISNSNWIVNGTGEKWEITNTAGHTGEKSIKLNNFNQYMGDKDEFYSSPFDLSGITSTAGVTLSFRYAYRKIAENNSDILNVSVSNDCGSNFALRKSLNANTMANGTLPTSSEFTPSTISDWKTAHVTNITSSYWVENLLVKFELINGEGNNLFIDNINIYPGPSNDNLVVSIDENSDFINSSLFPNPAEQEFQIEFYSTKENIDFIVQITDLSGKVIQNHTIQANQGVNQIYISSENLSSGTYFVKLTDGISIKTMQLIKE